MMNSNLMNKLPFRRTHKWAMRISPLYAGASLRNSSRVSLHNSCPDIVKAAISTSLRLNSLMAHWTHCRTCSFVQHMGSAGTITRFSSCSGAGGGGGSSGLLSLSNMLFGRLGGIWKSSKSASMDRFLEEGADDHGSLSVSFGIFPEGTFWFSYESNKLCSSIVPIDSASCKMNKFKGLTRHSFKKLFIQWSVQAGCLMQTWYVLIFF